MQDMGVAAFAAGREQVSCKKTAEPRGRTITAQSIRW